MRQNSLILIVAIFFSCSQTSRLRTHENLISVENVLVMEDGDHASGYYTDHENFIKSYISEKQSGDTLIVTTLKEINACGKTVGDIRISKDTLFLETKNVSDESCASVTFNKFTYRIENSTKQKYIVKSSK
jgi:hypothetical protein